MRSPATMADGLACPCGLPGLPARSARAGTGPLFDLAEAINGELGRGRVRVFDLGGGLPARYRETDTPPSPTAYATALAARCPGLFSGAYRCITEFGRRLHAPCAVAVSRVEYVKIQPGHKTAVLHLGADAFVRECYHPKAWPHRTCLLDAEGREKTGRTAIWHLAGPLCFSGIFRLAGAASPVEPGDLVVIRDVGRTPCPCGRATTAADAPGAWPAPRAIFGAARARNGRGRPGVLARRFCGRSRDFGPVTRGIPGEGRRDGGAGWASSPHRVPRKKLYERKTRASFEARECSLLAEREGFEPSNRV